MITLWSAGVFAGVLGAIAILSGWLGVHGLATRFQEETLQVEMAQGKSAGINYAAEKIHKSPAGFILFLILLFGAVMVILSASLLTLHYHYHLRN